MIRKKDILVKTIEKRLYLLHQRAWKLNKKKNKRTLIFSAIQSTLLLCLLIVLTISFGSLPEGMYATQYVGASMLDESAGGYVLVAVIAFSVGVIITTVIQRYLKKTRK